METRALTLREIEFCKSNARQFDYLFSICVRKCSNPECQYPLSALVENFYSTNFEGKVCELCHVLEDAVNQQAGLREAHQAWKRDQDHKKKLGDGKNYF